MNNLKNEGEQTTDSKKVSRGPSYRKLDKMNYLEILDHYMEYPSKNLRFNVTVDDEKRKVKFLTEEDKAFGWNQTFSKNKKASKFLQTNLHYLPEHLWDDLVPFVDQTAGSLVGYRVRDGNINFFVHKADSDSLSRELYDEINMKKLAPCWGNISEESKTKIKRLNDYLIERGIDSWLTIRATKLLKGLDEWRNAVTHFVTPEYLDKNEKVKV